jgi:FHA domain
MIELVNSFVRVFFLTGAIAVEAALISSSGRTVLSTSLVTIGRRADNTLVIQDAKASSRHAEIRPMGEGYCIVDMGSTNGTFVNEQRIGPNVPQALKPNDIIRIGETRFTYEAQAYPATVLDAPQNNAGYLPTVAAAPPSIPSMPPSYDPNPVNPMFPPPDPNAPYGATVAAPSPYTAYQGGQFAPPPAYDAQAPYQQPPPYYPPYGPQGQVGQVGQPPYGQGQPQSKLSPASLMSRFKSDNRFRLYVIVGGAVLLLIIVGIVVVRAGASSPTGTLTQYCNDFKAGDFNSAYDLLSSNLQSQVSRSQYVAAEQPGIQSAGGVTNCSATNVSESDPSATGAIVYTFGDGKTITAQYTLVDQNGTWKISNENVPTQ